jgi:hypothetical protein
LDCKQLLLVCVSGCRQALLGGCGGGQWKAEGEVEAQKVKVSVAAAAEAAQPAGGGCGDCGGGSLALGRQLRRRLRCWLLRLCEGCCAGELVVLLLLLLLGGGGSLARESKARSRHGTGPGGAGRG